MFKQDTIERFKGIETPFYYYNMDVLRQVLVGIEEKFEAVFNQQGWRHSSLQNKRAPFPTPCKFHYFRFFLIRSTASITFSL